MSDKQTKPDGLDNFFEALGDNKLEEFSAEAKNDKVDEPLQESPAEKPEVKEEKIEKKEAEGNISIDKAEQLKLEIFKECIK